MKPDGLTGVAGKRYLLKDHVGILLLLVIGIVGELTVFLIPDPLKILAPQLPMLAPQYWSGSYIGTKLFFTDNWRVSYNPDTPWSLFLWEEKRGFYQSLYLSEGDFVASVEQTVIWYADAGENASVWKKELDTGAYNGWPILERRLGSDEPAFFLACNPDLSSSPPQCWYLTYWRHWFSAVLFYRQVDGELIMQDIDQITARLDQLLMSAPD